MWCLDEVVELCCIVVESQVDAIKQDVDGKRMLTCTMMGRCCLDMGWDGDDAREGKAGGYNVLHTN